MDETTAIVIIALTVLGVLLIAAMLILLYPRITQDSEERRAQTDNWNEISDRLAAAEARWKGDFERERQRNDKLEAELGLVTSAYQEITSSLHVTEAKLKRAEEKIRELERRDKEKDAKIRRLKQQIVQLGGSPDTGPLES